MTTDGSPDVPPDVASVLHQLFDAAQASEESLDTDEFRATVETAQTVTRNKLPESDLRAQLLHGTERVLVTRKYDESVATEYIRGMQRRLAEATGETGVLDDGAVEDEDTDDRDDSVE